jgi:hypothetical protein
VKGKETVTRTKPSYPELQRRSPTRAPAWRWERAQALVREGRHVSRRKDDEETALAVCYLRARRRCRHDRGDEQLAYVFPDVHAARQLHERGGNTAVVVQARLLAQQSYEDVVRSTGVPLATLKVYEAIFFNVTDRLQARDWITIQAVRWWSFNPTTGRDPATVLRAYAYHGGAILLDAALPYLLGGRRQAGPGPDATTPEGRLDRSLRLAILIDTLPWGANADAKLLKLRAELLADARQVASPAQGQAVVARNAAEVLESLAAETLRRCPARGRATGDGADDLQAGATA